MLSKPGASRSRGLTDLRGRCLLTFSSWVFPTLATPAPTYNAGFGEEVFRLPLFPEAVGLGTSWATLCLNPAYIWQLLYLDASADCVLVYIYHVVTLGSGGFDNL